MASLEDMPNEVLETTMIYVRYIQHTSRGEYDDLRALCLVSHRFAHTARRVLYRDVRVNDCPELPHRCQLWRLVSNVLSVPRLGKYVKYLNINYMWGRSEKEILVSECCGSSADIISTALRRIQWLRHAESDALVALLLVHLPNLELLQLGSYPSDTEEFVGSRKRDEFLPAVIAAKIQNPEGHWAKLSEVRLKANCESAWSIAAFALLPSIRTLRFSTCNLLEGPVIRSNLAPLNLTILEVDNCNIAGVDFVGLVYCCGSLQHLHIENTSLQGHETITHLGDALRHAATTSLKILKTSRLCGLGTHAGTWGSFQQFTQLEKMFLQFSDLLGTDLLDNDLSEDDQPVDALASLLPQHVVSVSLELIEEVDTEYLRQQIKGILAVRQQGALLRLQQLEVVVDKYYGTWDDNKTVSLEKTCRDIKEDFEASGLDLQVTIVPYEEEEC